MATNESKQSLRVRPEVDPTLSWFEALQGTLFGQWLSEMGIYLDEKTDFRYTFMQLGLRVDLVKPIRFSSSHVNEKGATDTQIYTITSISYTNSATQEKLGNLKLIERVFAIHLTNHSSKSSVVTSAYDPGWSHQAYTFKLIK